ncbi:hypothetical protein Hanom_Chr14g01261871 [Helianthus anomalus]
MIMKCIVLIIKEIQIRRICHPLGFKKRALGARAGAFMLLALCDPKKRQKSAYFDDFFVGFLWVFYYLF